MKSLKYSIASSYFWAFMYVVTRNFAAFSSSGRAARYFLKCSIAFVRAAMSLGCVEPGL